MDKFVTKRSEKKVNTLHSKTEKHQQNIKTLKSNKSRQYNDCYLSIGFTWRDGSVGPLPLCIICGEQLSNSAMAPVKLKRHLITKHEQFAKKDVEFFKRLLRNKDKQSTKFQATVKVSDKSQEASFLVAELVAKEMKAHTITESLILPACRAIEKTMLGEDAEKEINKIPLSNRNSTISRRINEMSNDIQANVTDKLKNTNFALQVDESTDLSGKARLLAFIRFISDEGYRLYNLQ
jgi:hypothetical protein